VAQCGGRNEKIEIAYCLSAFTHGPAKLSEPFANFLIKTKDVHAREKPLERLLTALWSREKYAPSHSSAAETTLKPSPCGSVL